MVQASSGGLNDEFETDRLGIGLLCQLRPQLDNAACGLGRLRWSRRFPSAMRGTRKEAWPDYCRRVTYYQSFTGIRWCSLPRGYLFNGTPGKAAFARFVPEPMDNGIRDFVYLHPAHRAGPRPTTLMLAARPRRGPAAAWHSDHIRRPIGETFPHDPCIGPRGTGWTTGPGRFPPRT